MSQPIVIERKLLSEIRTFYSSHIEDFTSYTADFTSYTSQVSDLNSTCNKEYAQNVPLVPIPLPCEMTNEPMFLCMKSRVIQ